MEAEEAFAEERWIGGELEIGPVVLRLVERVPRCRMIDIRQDGVDPETRWLTSLARERDMSLGVYAEVSRPGRITVGSRARLC